MLSSNPDNPGRKVGGKAVVRDSEHPEDSLPSSVGDTGSSRGRQVDGDIGHPSILIGFFRREMSPFYTKMSQCQCNLMEYSIGRRTEKFRHLGKTTILGHENREERTASSR